MFELIAHFPSEQSALVTLAGVIALISLAAFLHPVLAIAGGLTYLAVAAWLVVDFISHDFQTPGSAAGMVILVYYAMAALFFAGLGLFHVFWGVGAHALRKSFISTRAALCVLAVPVVVVIATYAQKRLNEVPVPPPRKVEGVDRTVVRRVQVEDAYALSWKASERAPALTLALAAADLSADGRYEVPTIAETVDGPRNVELLVMEAQAGTTLTLHRDVDSLDDATFDGLRAKRPGPLHALWVSREKGAWRLLGFECGPKSEAEFPAIGSSTDPRTRCYQPQGVLARLVPRLFGFGRARLYVTEDRGACRTSFPWRERVATVSTPGKCFDEASLVGLAASVSLLDRLERDTATPPSQAERLDRARSAVARCEEAPAKSSPQASPQRPSSRRKPIGPACRYAAQLAARELASAPVEASSLMLRVIDRLPSDANKVRAAQLDAVIAALKPDAATAGSREMLRAHAMRLDDLGGSEEPRSRALAKASFDMVLTLGPAHLAVDDPLLETVLDGVSAIRVHPTEESSQLAMLNVLHEKALAGSAPDLELKARYAICRLRVAAALERELLKACAENFLATWQARVAGGLTFDPFQNERELAIAIGRMYVGYAYGVRDRAAGEEGLARVRELAAGRFASHSDRGIVSGALKEMDGLLLELPRTRAAMR